MMLKSLWLRWLNHLFRHQIFLKLLQIKFIIEKMNKILSFFPRNQTVAF